ncbi:type II toxin-antitoxin system VapB family antitoxin [uncultured Enterovirga sp.]|uniref:type II toxin-antitoxin system VapB family antitoxin n=1 Tax=uncultured Enterovirga sp. TaxID=2026352 RepID=UPI0035C9BF8C
MRSDEAYARASDLARRFHKTTTEIVLDALRAYSEKTDARDELGLTADQRADYEAIRTLARQTGKHAPPDLTSDHGWLYDEKGLPT